MSGLESSPLSIDDLLNAINSLLRKPSLPSAIVESGAFVSVANSDQSLSPTSTNDTWGCLSRSDDFSARPRSIATGAPLVNQRFQKKQVTSVPFWELQAPMNTMTLPDIFKLLEPEDDTCIVCVKKIHKLGFKSAKFLRQYFGLYGTVSKVVLLPSRQKDFCSLSYSGSSVGGTSVVRPASMAFVLMSSRRAVDLILMQEMHVIGECPIDVLNYDRNASVASQMRNSSFSSLNPACSRYSDRFPKVEC